MAVCDKCGRLLLGHGNQAEHDKTRSELERGSVPFEAGKVGALWVVAKDRAPASAAIDDGDDDEDDD